MIGAHCKLKDRFAKNFLTLENEQLIFSTRQHWISIIPSLVINIFLAATIALSIIFYSIFVGYYTLTYILIGLIILSLLLEISIKNVVEWFFHFYIVTNRKIVEVTYRPLFSRKINEVLLDQVRCTEVDVVTKGLISEIYNVGNVMLTFDRPTHEETFTIEVIKHPRRAAMHLADSFESRETGDSKRRLWYKPRNDDDSRMRSFEIIPQYG